MDVSFRLEWIKYELSFEQSGIDPFLTAGKRVLIRFSSEKDNNDNGDTDNVLPVLRF